MRDYGINIEYFAKPLKDYFYSNTKVRKELCSDIEGTEALFEFVKILEIAGHPVDTSICERLKNKMEEGGYGDK